MNAIEKLFPVSQQERSFQLKVRRDAGTAAPGWVQPQFVECKKCGRRATRQVWTKSLYVCPNCGVHLPIGAYYRLSTILDHGTFKELNPDLAPNDVLHFPDYQEKLAAASVKTGLKEAAVTATGRIGGVQAVAAVLDSRVFMGSMSTAVGEKITRAIEYAADKRLPLVIFSASGGARMQEGIFSLMQMAKTSAALERFSRSGGLYVSVLTHPTTGGVTAASAIAALQEAGSKLSRDMLKSAYRAFVQECYLCIDLMRQFYTAPRCFRITGESGAQAGFVDFDNRGLMPQPQGVEFGVALGDRLPVFDITVVPAKKSTYSRLSQNELAKELYGLGLFNPQLADQSLAVLDMMDFDGKDKVVEKISQNQTLYTLSLIHI